MSGSGRKEGWWSIPDYARRTGRGKKDCGRVMDAGAEKQGRIHAVCFMRDTAGAYLTVVLWHASYWMPVMIW